MSQNKCKKNAISKKSFRDVLCPFSFALLQPGEIARVLSEHPCTLDELTKVNLALEWYRVAVEMERSVAKAELAKNQATEALESAKGDIESLALYNSTQQARDLFRDICSVTDNIKQIAFRCGSP